jgi:aspartate-semialdehyde dehydrogenase
MEKESVKMHYLNVMLLYCTSVHFPFLKGKSRMIYLRFLTGVNLHETNESIYTSKITTII